MLVTLEENSCLSTPQSSPHEQKSRILPERDGKSSRTSFRRGSMKPFYFVDQNFEPDSAIARLEMGLRHPSTLYDPSNGQKLSSIRTFHCYVGNKVKVYGKFSLQDVLDGKMDEPLDLLTFGNFCHVECNDDQLLFLLTARLFRQLKLKGVMYKQCLERIAEWYIVPGAEYEMNVSYGMRERMLRAIRESDGENCNYKVLRAAEREVYRMMNLDVFHRFKHAVVHEEPLRDERDCALWCYGRDKMTCARFVTLPDAINTVHTRLNFFLTSMLLALGFTQFHLREQSVSVLGESMSKIYLGYCLAFLFMLLRAVAGPRIDPQSMFVIFLLAPLVNRLQLCTQTCTVSNPWRPFEILGCSTIAIIILCCSMKWERSALVASVMQICVLMWQVFLGPCQVRGCLSVFGVVDYLEVKPTILMGKVTRMQVRKRTLRYRSGRYGLSMQSVGNRTMSRTNQWASQPGTSSNTYLSNKSFIGNGRKSKARFDQWLAARHEALSTPRKCGPIAENANNEQHPSRRSLRSKPKKVVRRSRTPPPALYASDKEKKDTTSVPSSPSLNEKRAKSTDAKMQTKKPKGNVVLKIGRADRTAFCAATKLTPTSSKKKKKKKN